MPNPWVFTQLGGPKKTLRLEGHAAPHGRPKKGAVVSSAITVRQSETYYPGNDVPTRHVFGHLIEPFQLRGVFTDRRGGKGYAKARDAEVRAFVADKQPIKLVWGDRINATGLVERYEGGWEGDGEIPWTMTISIDEDHTLGRPKVSAFAPVAPKSRMKVAMGAMAKSLKDMGAPRAARTAFADLGPVEETEPLGPPTMRGSIFDTVESLVYAVNGAAASLNAVVNQIGNLTTAPFHLLRTLKAGISTFRSAITRLRGYYDDLTVNIALESRDAREMRRFWDVQAAWGASSLQALRELTEMEREATLSQRSRTLAYYEATDGDTWERIANQFYGSPDRSGDIQSANGVEAGEPPTPGDIYLIPK